MKELEKKEIKEEKTFQEVAEPLMKWISENYHPYTKVLLTSYRAEILEGIEGCSSPAGEWGYETETEK
jgi:hypothetical protein